MSRLTRIALRWIPVAIAPLSLCLLLIACSSKAPQAAQPSQTASSQSATLTPITPTIPPKLSWQELLGNTTAPQGWQVRPCEGDGPFLCVFNREVWVGSLEMSVYPLENLPDFQKILSKTGATSGSGNAQTRQEQAQRLNALKAWVADYYAFFSSNRQPEYGTQITFSAQEPQVVMVGPLQGLRYGFTGQKPDGTLHEQQVGFVAFDGAKLYVISTGFDPLSETGTFKRLEDFREFEPYLAQLVANIKLPIAS